MFDLDLVQLSRIQFGMTAAYHFIFVPLTLGLSFLLGIMETVYVLTGKTIWRDMVKFWGLLFGINFAMGVATGITMEFQFGMNWSYYSHYVGDIFGTPLAIEGLMAFFLEATFVGLFFFGWDRLSKYGHLMVTWLVAIGSNLSAVWILIANGWMQNPVGAVFNFETSRMELTSFWDMVFNPVAQSKFVHTVSAGYVTGCIFVMAVSAYYLLRNREHAIARRSMLVASAFGLASALSVVVLGDESGYTANANQKMKLAVIEGMWETEKPPADLTLIAWPDEAARHNLYEIKIPYVLGLIATRSFTETVPGIKDLVEINKDRIREGMVAYEALQKIRSNPGDSGARSTFDATVGNLGYGLLLKRYTPNVIDATEAQIEQAAWDTVPAVAPLFWSFRLMVGLGFYFIAFFLVAFVLGCRRAYDRHRGFLVVALFSLPLPWIAAEVGWFVAEYGRQPWAIEGVLPTFLGVSNIPVSNVAFSLAGFLVLYSTLLVVDVFLLAKYIRLGPSGKGSPRQPGLHPHPAQ